MSEIDECRLAVMSAYIWIVRMRSLDPTEMDRIRDLQVKMEEVQSGFDELFPS